VAEPVYLSLGSNLGNRGENLHLACESLTPEVHLLKTSSVYVTPPWGYHDQPEFLNQVVEVQTDLAPLALLKYLKAIEADMGRLETFRYGPRLIDIDILFYEGCIVQCEELHIPHPRLAERAFVLVPLHEIAPDFVHPELDQTIADLLSAVSAEGVRRL